MTSALGHAILSVLARGEATGYRLSRWMRRPVGYFWTARHSQIYPELSRLEADGLVRHRVIDGAGPRPTKEYALTDPGRAELRRWLTTDPAPRPVRDEESLRAFSLWLAEPDAARDYLRARRAEHAERLADYQRQYDEIDALDGSHDPTDALWSSRIALRNGIGTRRAAVEWCEWVLAELGRS